jgi:hypothetical protein
MCTERTFRVSRKNVFSLFSSECLHTMAMETRKNSEGDVVVFMALMFLCRFHLFGMTEL